MNISKNAPVLIHNLDLSIHEAFAKAYEYSERIRSTLSLLDNIRSFIHQGSSSIRLSFLDSIPLFNKQTRSSCCSFSPPPNLLIDPSFPFSFSYFAHKAAAKERLTSYIHQENLSSHGDARRLLSVFDAIDRQGDLCALIHARINGIQRS